MLALDTATESASVALHDGERVLTETTWLAGQEHSTRLLVEIARSLEVLGKSPSDLTGLAVGRGPGSYTGVRVALSLAKGLAAGLGLPLWSASTLDVLARAAGPVSVPVRPILNAGRGRLATALYQRGERLEEMQSVSSDRLEDLIGEPVYLIGDLTDSLRERLADTAAVLADPAACVRRAGFLAEIGWDAARAQLPGDPAIADALYLPPAQPSVPAGVP